MSDMLLTLLTLQNNVKLNHWQTKSFAKHVANDKLFNKLVLLTDRFVETFQGSRDITIELRESIKLYNMSEEEISSFLRQMKNKIKNWKLKETDLDNIVQEILEAINNTLYLFSLN